MKVVIVSDFPVVCAAERTPWTYSDVENKKKGEVSRNAFTFMLNRARIPIDNDHILKRIELSLLSFIGTQKLEILDELGC